MRKFIKIFCGALSALTAILMAAVIYADASLPDRYWVCENNSLEFSGNIPVTATCSNNDAVVTSAAVGSDYGVSLKLFGIFPIKSARVEVVDSAMVIPCGTPFGIKMFTKGVLVVGLSKINSKDGYLNPAYNAGIRVGDVVLSINDHPVQTNEEVSDIITSNGSGELSIRFIRNGSEATLNVKPVKDVSDGKFKVGMWVRDSAAGIGTMTFYYPARNVLAGLGHGVCDVDTGEIIPISGGEIVDAQILGCVKGVVGMPGELRGSFSGNDNIGSIIENCETGIYSFADYTSSELDAVQVAMKQEVKAGEAFIYSTVDGKSAQKYSIEIEKINYSDRQKTKNMVIKITDKRLIEQTGGIVQGMSGSPIIQNGKLVGAVTHVLINDCTRGYAIFAENMLETAQSVTEENLKEAS